MLNIDFQNLLSEFIDAVFDGSTVITVFWCCRFYSHDSSFVHGGIEKPGEELPPVMGQAVNAYLVVTC